LNQSNEKAVLSVTIDQFAATGISVLLVASGALNM
jgi:hypothetical protein